MVDAVIQDWHTANQRYLTSEVERVREMLDRSLARSDATPPDPAARTAEPGKPRDSDGLTPPPALETLVAGFELSDFERDLLLLCAGTELSTEHAASCAAAHGDPRRNHATFSLALSVLPGAHWSALSPGGPLRRWRLVEPRPAEGLTAGALRIDERVVHYLTGVPCLDERLHGIVEPVAQPPDLAPSHLAVARKVADFFSCAGDSSGGAAVQITGPDPLARSGIAASCCVQLGTPPYELRASDIPTSASERAVLSRLWERESLFLGALLIVDCDDLDANASRALRQFVDTTHVTMLLLATDPILGGRRPLFRFEIDKAPAGEQRRLWREALGSLAGSLDGALDGLAAHFDVGLREIRTISSTVQRMQVEEGELPGTLWNLCREQARPRLDDLARRIEPRATWADLIVPEVEGQLLRDVAVHVRNRAKVYESWGFAAKSSRGLGISALFHGPSGTGKTMAAEVLANELALDLYQIDLSAVISKYIGETEKHLRRVFDAAERGGAILLFNEADALFGKRSEVKDSHDRYANIEVSYLLQRMEDYRGLALLTTNSKKSLDPAFLRRIRFVVAFPFPNAADRGRIWASIFPPETPTRGLDVGKLSRLSVAGGSIRNIALNGSFLAAEEDSRVAMRHLLRAARTEYAKLERTLSEKETRGWL